MGGMEMPDMASMQAMLQQNPEMVSAMMDNPMVQQALENPAIIEAMMQANPQMRSIMESNPEVAQIMRDPALIRQGMQIARNPNLMQEMMRNNDRAMANIENVPGGFDALHRMYENVQAPMMEAAAGGNAPVAASASHNPFKSMLQGGSASGHLVTPWTSSSTRFAAPRAASGFGANPFASFAPGGGAAPNPFEAFGSGGFGGGQMPDVEGLATMLETNPQMQQMMQNVMSNPAMMDMALRANPQMRAMVEANPHMASMLQNPQFLQSMMNPQTLRAVSQAQQQMSGMGINPMQGFGANPMAALPPQVAAHAPTRQNLEQQFASQLQQLEAMGFSNRDQNLQALALTGGNVEAAVDRILSGNFN